MSLELNPVFEGSGLQLGPVFDVTGVPTIGTVTAGDTSLSFVYTGPATHYRVFLLGGSPGSWVSIPASPVSVTGLTANTEYTIQISGNGSTVADEESAGTNNPGTGGGELTPGTLVTFAASAVIGATFSATASSVAGVTVSMAATGAIGSVFSASATAVGGVSVSFAASAPIGAAFAGGVLVADVIVPPAVTLDPVSVTAPEGSTVTLTAAFSGFPAPTVQWFRDPAAAGSWTTIPGATGLSYTTPPLSFFGGEASSGDRYKAVATNGAGTAETEAATVTVSLEGSVTADAGALRASRESRRRTLRATSERMVNYMLKRAEGPEKNQFFREQVPGLTQLATLSGPIRGAWWTGSRLFVVAGASLLEIGRDWTATERGTLGTSTGRVSIAQGLFALVLVDGPNGYVLQLSNNTFARITDPDFLGSDRVAFLDGRFIFVERGTQRFYWSAGIDTPSDYSALDFASAESAPDNIVGHLVDHREVWLFGEYTTEVWVSAPTVDQVYQRQGASIEAGLAAPHTAQQIDNTVYFLSKDKRGQGMVFAIGGSSAYQPLRISTNALEEQIAKLDDLSGAWAWTYQDAGQTFYVLQVPGLESTWVYDASTQQWHERAEWTGDLERWRADTHVFAFGKHVVGDSAGRLYELDPYEYTNAGDPLYRLWVTPHSAAPTRQRVYFSRLRLDVTTGETRSGLSPQIELSYSNDGGYTWGAWSPRSSGELGQWAKPVKWDRLGMGRDRVWRFRCTDDAKVSIVGLHVDAQEGTS